MPLYQFADSSETVFDCQIDIHKNIGLSSKLQIETRIDKIDIQAWDAFVINNPHGNIYQMSDMYRLFESVKNFRPYILVAYDGERILGVLLAVVIREFGGPFGYFSSRTVIYGGPVLDENCKKEEVLKRLLEKLVNSLSKKSVFVQFRNFRDWSTYKSIFENAGFEFFERLNFIVNTSDKEKTWRRISESKRRQIRKALKSGAKIIEPSDIKQVKEFYRILHDLYKNKVRKPLPKWSFFKNFYLLSNKSRLGVIKLIAFEGKIIGGIVAPIFSDQVIYEWYICGLDYEYKHLHPSTLATWAAIEYGIENGVRTFDFMGVGVPDRDYGVREFKAKFGGELTNYGRFGRINNRFIYSITEIGFNFLALLKKI